MRQLGRHHPLLQELGRLTGARARKEQGRFLVEGLRALEELQASDLQLEMLLVGEPSERGQAIVARAAGAELLQVDPAVLERLAPAETSQGLLGVVRLPDPPSLNGCRSLLVCEEVADPGNLGTLLRSARASGTEGVVLLGGVDPYSPKVVRAAAGALFRLPVARAETLDGLEGFWLVATVVEGGDNLYRAELPDRPAWLVGSEARGLSDEALRRAKTRVTIPMRGGESLNVAVCGALLMFEWLRRQEVSPARQSPRL